MTQRVRGGKVLKEVLWGGVARAAQWCKREWPRTGENFFI